MASRKQPVTSFKTSSTLVTGDGDGIHSHGLPKPKPLYNVKEDDEEILMPPQSSSAYLGGAGHGPTTTTTTTTPSSAQLHQIHPKIDLKKEYTRFCKLYSSEPLDIVAIPLENATYGERDSLTVDLKGRGLRGVDCIALSKILALDAPITKLILADCLLLPQGFQALIDGICKNSRLQTLELRGNNITGDMTSYLAKLLANNRSLKRLLLEWNKLGSMKESFSNFCEALSTNTGLEYLDLRNNVLTPENASELSDALKTNKTLRELDLRWNAIGLAGAKAIWESLHFNFALQQIHLCGNSIPDDFVRSIEKCLQHQSEREGMMDEYAKRTTLLTRQLQQTEQQHQNEIFTIVSVFDAEEAELKDAIKESYEHINELDFRLQSETGRNQGLVKQVEKLQSSLELAIEKEETLRKALEIKEEHTEQLEQYFKTELEKLKQNHELRIKNYQDELESRYKNVEGLTGRITKLESALEMKSEEVVASNERIEVMKKESAEARKLFEERIKTEKEKWASWKNEVETAEKLDMQVLQEEVKQVQVSTSLHIKKLEQAKHEAEEEIRQMKIGFVKLRSEAEEATTKLRISLNAEHDKEIQSLMAQLTAAKEEISKLQTGQQEYLASARKFESENTTLTRQNENLKQQIANMDQELLEKDAAIHTSLARARNEVKEQIEQLGKEEEANKTLRTQVLELQEQIAMLTLKQTREVQEKFSEMDHLKTQVERREEELHRLKEEDMRRAALLHEAFLAYMRSTSAATGIPLPQSFFQPNPDLVHASIASSTTKVGGGGYFTPGGDHVHGDASTPAARSRQMP